MAISADTRSRLIDVGMDQFYRHGYGAVGVQELCAQAGVSKSSFYHFFPSKEDLALAVVETRWAGFQAMLAPLEASGLAPLDKVRAVFGGMHGMAQTTLTTHGGVFGCPFGSLGSELSHSAEPVRARVAAVLDDMAALFARWLSEARDAGDLDASISIADAADDLVAAVQAAGVIGRVYNSPQRVRDTGERLVRGILGDAPAPRRGRRSTSQGNP